MWQGLSQQPDFAPAMPEYSHQFFGSISPILYKCLTWCLVTFAVHTISPTATVQDKGSQKNISSHRNGRLQYHHLRKAKILTCFISLFLKMHFFPPPCCLSSFLLSHFSPSIHGNQTWQMQYGAVCYDLSPSVPLPTVSSCLTRNSSPAASKLLYSLSQSAIKG